MLKKSLIWQFLASLLLASPAALAIDVRICTDLGAIDVELDERRAPLHTASFLRYAESGFYGGTVLHRVIPGSMVQGGSFDQALERRPAPDTVRNESTNGLSNQRGTLSASRSEDPDSASSQFFFNLGDNSHLDGRPGMPGYSVFGRVTAGLELLDEIAALPTRRARGLEDVPVPLVGIRSVTTLERDAVFGLSIEPDPATLQAQFDMAVARRDAAGVIAAVDALRRSCIEPDAPQRIADAEAAITLGRPERARYGLEQYLATAGPADPEQRMALRLLASLPEPERTRDIAALIVHCRAADAPSVPDGRFTERGALAAVENAVQRYRDTANLYLDCLVRVLQTEDLSEDESIALTRRHNDVIVEMTAVSLRFNRAVENYRTARSGLRE